MIYNLSKGFINYFYTWYIFYKGGTQMIKKYLQRKININADNTNEEINEKMEIEYYLLESESSGADVTYGQKVYGIEIIKKTQEEKIESEFVRNLSTSVDIVNIILDKMVKNIVTPVGMPFVLDDLIGV
jgi:hypothetical protein